MEESVLLFNLFYLLLCMCIIYPPEEFHRTGLTIEKLFSPWLGDEHLNFVIYHQKRTSLNVFVHSCLPSFYFLIHRYKFNVFYQYNEAEEESELDPDFPLPQQAVAFKTLTWKVAQRFSLLALLVVPALIFNWYQQDWKRHPITQTLVKFSNVPNSTADVISDIGNEIRRHDIFRKKLNSISTVIATENWIIKTALYNVHFAHQSDTTLSVAKIETYTISQDNNNDTLQMISIMVNPNRANVADFYIRINALEFRNLEERVIRPIAIPPNVQFHRNVIDRFIDVFKEHVSLNPVYKADRVAEKCYACMIAEPNVKIQKQCQNFDSEGRPLADDLCCKNCYCRPMWCVECLARWFAARQNEHEREVWLEQKCTCPMCRAKFCLLDVCYIEEPDVSLNNDNNNDNET